MREEAKAAGAKIVQARSYCFPSAFATGAYSVFDAGMPAVNNYDLGIVLSWPLFNGFATDHQVAEARYEEKRSSI